MPRGSASKKTALAREQERPDIAPNEPAGRRDRVASTPNGPSSLTKPRPRPIWHRSGVGRRGARGRPGGALRPLGRVAFKRIQIEGNTRDPWPVNVACRTMTFAGALRQGGIVAPWVTSWVIDLAHRWADQWRELPHLGRAGSSAGTARGRHRRDGQARQPPGTRHLTGHPRGRRKAVLPARLFARPEPYRTGVCQAETPAAQSRRAQQGAVWRRIGSRLHQFTPQECENYIRNSGYGSV
jgi:hypothetical protein